MTSELDRVTSVIFSQFGIKVFAGKAIMQIVLRIEPMDFPRKEENEGVFQTDIPDFRNIILKSGKIINRS